MNMTTTTPPSPPDAEMLHKRGLPQQQLVVPPYNFGSFTLSEGLFLQRIAQLQAENAVLLREVGANRDQCTAALVEREKELQTEKDKFMRSVSETCNTFRLRALNAEEKLRKAQAELPRDGPDADAEADADAGAADRARELVASLRVEISASKKQCEALQALVAETEARCAELRKHHQQHAADRSKAGNAKEKEKDAVIKRLTQDVHDERSVSDALQSSLATKDELVGSLTIKFQEAELAAKRLAAEVIQLSHLPPIIDTMQLYLRVETEKMYKAGVDGGLENFAQVALSFLRSYRAGGLDKLVDAAVAERREQLKKNLVDGYEAGRAYVMESLVPLLYKGGAEPPPP